MVGVFVRSKPKDLGRVTGVIFTFHRDVFRGTCLSIVDAKLASSCQVELVRLVIHITTGQQRDPNLSAS
jgi:hypothetical protein